MILDQFRRPFDFEGVHNFHFFDENQHEMKQNEVQEGVLEKHDFGIDF